MDFSMNNFYILGMPRSRTLWFNTLFSESGISCIHEHFSVHEKRETIKGVRGYSDTNPLTAPDYGDSPVLIIERNLEQVMDSVYNAFDKPEGIKSWRHSIENYIKVYKEAIDKICPKNFMRVNFDDIDGKLFCIWKFLIPDIPYDPDYLWNFKKKIIKTENRDIKGSLEHTFGSIEEFSSRYDLNLMDCYRITDYQVAQYIVNELWYEISEDNAPAYTPDLIKEYWIGLLNDKELVGCARFHQLTSITWEAHAFILPDFRKKYGPLSCLTTLNWMIENTDCQKIVANVPNRFPNVMGFLEKIGFKKEGVNRQSFTKDGKLWDIVNYGLTRTEIEVLL